MIKWRSKSFTSRIPQSNNEEAPQIHVALSENRFPFINKDRNVPAQPAFSSSAQLSYCSHSFIYLLWCAERKRLRLWKEEGWGVGVALFGAGRWLPLWEVLFCQVSAFESRGKTLYFLSCSSHPQRRTKHQAATPPTNSLTLIVFMSPWKCPQISDLSKLFCLYNPLCSTWPRSIPTASSSSL